MPIQPIVDYVTRTITGLPIKDGDILRNVGLVFPTIVYMTEPNLVRPVGFISDIEFTDDRQVLAEVRLIPLATNRHTMLWLAQHAPSLLVLSFEIEEDWAARFYLSIIEQERTNCGIFRKGKPPRIYVGRETRQIE
jgi:hypothetical protein